MELPQVEVPTIAIAGGAARFPVRRIFCVGQNYADHAREMGSDPDREPPFFFTKPADAAIDGGCTLPFPLLTDNLHHEIELVVALGAGGANLSPAAAAGAIFGFAAGIDLTRRDLQALAKERRRPWDMAKGFDRSAPIAPLSRAAPAPQAAIRLAVNGEERQHATLADMIWPVPALLATLSTYVELRPGDLVFTGTPSGVGPIRPGDAVEGWIDGLAPIAIRLGG